MLPYIVAAIYILACFGCAYLGRTTVLGPVGTFLVSLVLTPVLVFIAIIAFARRIPTRRPQ